MKKSKYIGRQYGNWTVEKCYLNANYEQSTAHNAYHYVLARITSDGKCDKVITISGKTMTDVDRGRLDIETVAKNKKKVNSDNILYRFN